MVPARDFGPGADLAAWPRDFIEVPASGLGITWDRADGDARSGAAMEAQVQGVWRALHRVTERVTVRNAMPGVPQDAQTLPARCRMGPHMASLMREHGWCLRYGSVYRLV
ncbi:hypothetical protein CCO03_11825 [Comamonas serinivorans]|uniref:Uncharacterized protein n=1 Tax=Comamonas serinivorans TaxID=1082851 RepID=A0A1Y0ENV5_9BURK|nr:hypothetical protein [Comamonas serinivorans]ARU05276.1 hypothetical protein CCO03_11825 [Comamonas serinivorans]